jgi:hypothetical protein
MGRKTSTALHLALACLVGLLWPVSDAAARMAYGAGGRSHRGPGASGVEIVLEGGLAEPLGEHADPFGVSEGLGAGTGYELGLRVRQPLGSMFAVAPTFHYVQFGATSGVADFPEGADLYYEVETSLFRYGLDLQMFMAGRGAAIRPFLTGGVALSHNRYRDSLQYYQDFRTSMNGPSWSAGFGLKMHAIELTAAYHWNRFDTDNLTARFDVRDYDWDYAILRLGFAFGGR